MSERPVVMIYTDGACVKEIGCGGWGAYLLYRDKQNIERIKTIFGSEQNTTTIKMEMTAAIRALEILKIQCNVKLYTDNMDLQRGMTKKRRIRRILQGDKVKNLDLWQQLDKQADFHEITCMWVKSHSGNKGNEIADSLARKGRNAAMVAKYENDYLKNMM